MDSAISVFIFCVIFSYATAQQGCVSPPMECPNENITFWLYTSANVNTPHQVLAMDSDSITSAPWRAGAFIKILIHGYTGDKDSSPSKEIRPAYMKCCDYNVISVDYSPIARKPCYIQAARNTELVGMCTAQLIDQLVTKHGFDLRKFHVIGFSLGAQIAGFIANYLTCGRLERISALDPALPLFVTEDKQKKVDSGDAKYVDCLHTNALKNGQLEPCGVSDWFANGGLTQPGCVSSIEQNKPRCDHERASAYYGESITTDVGFYGTKCTYTTGGCYQVSSDYNVLYGEWMSLKANANKPHQVLAVDSDSITSAPWVAGAPIKILIHGYTNNKDSSPSKEIRPAYMKCCDYNVISVDYSPIARKPCYFQAARNTELVGKCTAQLIDQLVIKHGFDLRKFHVIGFSLGGQTAGFIANYLTCGRLERISALDPALPLFVTEDTKKKVDSGDAKYVDCLHTNALENGQLKPCGASDWFANGGFTQPGCVPSIEQISAKSGCDHARAPAYYAESITTEVGFYGTKCHSWITYMISCCNQVSSDDDVLYGEWMSLNTSGLYFFATNSESPFARGRNKKGSRRSIFNR